MPLTVDSSELWHYGDESFCTLNCTPSLTLTLTLTLGCCDGAFYEEEGTAAGAGYRRGLLPGADRP